MTNTINVSTRDFVRRESSTDEDGTPIESQTQYRGDLGTRAIRYSRELSFWPWGRTGGSLTTGTIEIDNRTGRYDQLVFRDLRDQDIQVKIPTKEGADIAAITAIVDGTEAPSDMIVRVSLKDTLTLLDVPIQDEVFDDDADESVEGRPFPITLGVARTIRPPMWEAFPATTGPAFRLHDATLSGIANVRDRGILLNPFVSPPQYALDPRIGNAGITLDVEPIGVVTMDASTSGDAIIPIDPVDELGGIGQFDAPFTTANAGNNGAITGWTFSSIQPEGGTAFCSYNSNLNGALLNAGSTQSGRAGLTSNVRHLESGKSYRWRLTVLRAVQFFSTAANVIASQGTFRLSATTTDVLQDATNPTNGQNMFLRRTLDANNLVGTYSGTYTVPEGVDRFVQVACLNGGNVVFGRLEFIELPDPPSDELEGIILKDYALEVVRRVGLSDDVLVTEDIDAIDPTEAQIGIFVDEPITALGVMRAPLDSYCADIFSDRQGRYRFAQLRDPELEVHTLTIDGNNLADPPRVSIDRAEGLTTSILARRNHYQYRESDFADNPTDIPLDLRERLKARGQFQRNAELPEGGLPTVYRHAVEAEPLLSIFDLPQDGKDNIQRVIDLYHEPRFIVECQIWLDPGEFVELNTIARLVYPRYGFDEGRNFLVFGVTDEVSDEPSSRIVRVRLWG